MLPAAHSGPLPQDPGIWLVGARGMLGRQLALEFENRGLSCFASDQEVDICKRQCLHDFARDKKFGWMINCAAYTAVDRAEDEPERALAVNAAGVENLARLAAGRKARLVHFSTDYVFPGDRQEPYREDDLPRPLSQYGRSKRQGEINLAANLETFFLFRISWLYGIYGPNFVRTMLKIFREKETARVVCDQFGSPTYAAALAANIAGLIASNSERYGVYHYCDRGVISWFDFAVAVMELGLEWGVVQKKIPLAAIPTSAFPTRAARPLRVILDSSKAVSELGFQVRDWKLNLQDFFREKATMEGTREGAVGVHFVWFFCGYRASTPVFGAPRSRFPARRSG
jgi:dTDP-4-dehydrorhamnose reductase